MKEKICCFTGHRSLPKEKVEQIVIRLNQEVDNLINKSVTKFISGGAVGFDQIAASLIVEKRQMGSNIRLIFALPYRNQDECWNIEQKKLYYSLISKADEVIYVSEEYIDGCMKKRNQFMVDRSAYCVCALFNSRSGTGQTVRYARQKGLEVINVVD